MRVLAFSPGCLVLFACAVAWGDVSDTAAARAQLQQGYALKQQGKCEEAIPHFVESVHLDRQPKTLTNLADCEEKLGRLAAAQAHFVEARDLAKVQGLEPLRGLAEQRLATLERKMPKLVVKLAKDAPTETTVLRDGAQLGAVSLNTPLPLDPGKHTVLARGGNLERKYEITLSEAETRELEVTPVGGLRVSSEDTQQPTPALPTRIETPSASPPPPPTNIDTTGTDRSAPNVVRIAGFTAIGLGAVGLVTGTVFALKLSKQNDESDSICPTGQPCMPDDVNRYNDAVDQAKTSRTLSAVGFGAGAALVLTGGLLVLTSRSSKSLPTSSLWWSPLVQRDGLRATLGGAW